MEKVIDMITINFIHQQVTKFIVLSILLANVGCSSVSTDKKDTMSKSLDNYIDTYKSRNSKSAMNVIMVSTKFERGVTEYIINDAPLDIFFGDVNKVAKTNKADLLLGQYKNIYCIVQSDSIRNFKYLFENLENADFEKAKHAQIKIGDDGKTYNVDLSLLNWNPELLIFYNITEGKKKIITN